MCKEESCPHTEPDLPDPKDPTKLENIRREATKIFTMIDADSDSLLNMEELMSLWGPSGSSFMLALHDDGDVYGLVTLDQWANFWEKTAAKQGDSVVQRELAKLKAELRAKVAPAAPVKKCKPVKTVKSGAAAAPTVKNRGLQKLAL